MPGYRLVAELGRGGMGAVYEAIDNKLNRRVALKLISDVLEGDLGSLARLNDEAEAIARLEHPNVVRIYRVGEHRGCPYLALELVRGGSLAKALAKGPLDVRQTIDVLRGVAAGTQHAHDHGVIHRDLKPGNILVGLPEPTKKVGEKPRSAPKITDFGIAKMLDNDHRRTKTGMFVGTLLYMAPELIDSPRAASPQSDVYSLGIILYECLTGLLPFVGESFAQTVYLIQEVEPLPPSRHRPGLPRGLDAVCRKALAKSPADRYPSAAAFAADLDRVAAGLRIKGQRVRLGPALRPVFRVGLWAVVLATVLAGLQLRGRSGDAKAAAQSGRELIARGDFAAAEAVTARGLQRTAGWPGFEAISTELDHHNRTARRGRLAADLHRLVDQLRFGFDTQTLADADKRKIAAGCESLWVASEQLTSSDVAIGAGRETQLRTDLLDLALLSADLLARDGSLLPDNRCAAIDRLDEAQRRFGPNSVLAQVREMLQTGGDHSVNEIGSDASAWELYALGRFRLNRGDTTAAARLLRRAVDKEPKAFWPNFYLALTAHRSGRPDEAVEAVSGFTVCLRLTENRRGLCHYNRAVAYEAIGKLEAACRDLDQAVALEPDLAVAVFRRGVVRFRLGRLDEATADLDRALERGYEPATVWYHLALVRRAAGDLPRAIACASEALKLSPTDTQYRTLVHEFQGAKVALRP